MAEVVSTKQRDRVAEAVSRIIQETQEGRLQWRPVNPDHVKLDVTPDERVHEVFLAQFQDHTLQLYKKSYEVVPSPMDFFYSTSLMPSRKDRHWISKVILEVVAANGVSSQPFAGIGALDDLLYAVKNRLAGTQQFLDAVVPE